MIEQNEYDGWQFQQDVKHAVKPLHEKKLKERGYYGVEFYWELNQQGAGACIEASINPNEFILAHNLYRQFQSIYLNHLPSIQIETDHTMYHHSNTMRIKGRAKYMFDIQTNNHFTEKTKNSLGEFLDYVLGQSQDYADEFYREVEDMNLNRLTG